MKAQAMYRREIWLLSFEDFQRLWQGRWDQRGRGAEEFCLTREDPEGAWEPSNIVCVERREHLRRQGLYKGLKNGSYRNKIST